MKFSSSSFQAVPESPEIPCCGIVQPVVVRPAEKTTRSRLTGPGQAVCARHERASQNSGSGRWQPFRKLSISTTIVSFHDKFVALATQKASLTTLTKVSRHSMLQLFRILVPSCHLKQDQTCGLLLRWRTELDNIGHQNVGSIREEVN